LFVNCFLFNGVKIEIYFYGLLLKEITDSYVEGNTFVKNTSGIYMEGASRIHMQKNIFKNLFFLLQKPDIAFVFLFSF